jgi:hypothetical protein
MSLVKKISITIILIIFVLTFTELLYKEIFWKNDQHKYADLLDSIQKYENTTDILFLSSSSNYFHPKTDSSNTTISKYLNLFFPGLRVNSINKGYAHTGVYESIIENLDDNAPIKAVIVSVDIRSFGAYWLYSDVETSYSSQLLMMNKALPFALRRFLLSLDYYDNKSNTERINQYLNAWKVDTLVFPYYFDFKTVNDWDYFLAHNNKFVNINGEVDLKKTDYACNLIKFYGFNINEKHPRIKNIDKIVQLSKQKKWKLILYIPAIDMNNAYSMVGKELPQLIYNNIDFIIKRYQNEVLIINNIDLINEHYFYEDYPTEHYTKEGKYLIAKEIANKIKPFFVKAYNDILIFDESINIKPRSINKQAEEIIRNQSWINTLEAKSIEKNVKIEYLLREDAYWALQLELRNTEVSKIKENIRTDTVWLSLIKDKALKNNNTLEQQIEDDAKWLANKKIANIIW